MSVIPFPAHRLKADSPPPYMVAVAPYQDQWAVWSITDDGNYLVATGSHDDMLLRSGDYAVRRGLQGARVIKQPLHEMFPCDEYFPPCPPIGGDAA